MQKINWDQFRIKNGNYRIDFEDLCYHLFCRKYNLTEGIRADYNQAGLETYPIVDKDDKKVGFQAKFFDNNLSDASSKKQIIDSITKAKGKFTDLNKIVIYTHQSFGSKNPKYKQEIEKSAGKIEIEWFLEKNFNTVLNQPKNLDLAQLYFGHGDEFGFIEHSCDNYKITLLNSAEYIDLPLAQNGSKKITDVVSETSKSLLIVGSPGSGKSILIHKLLQILGGLDKGSLRSMKEVITNNNALPMLINLKDCYQDSLENIIRNRQSDYQVRGISSSISFIYLFDGLDELNEDNADHVLGYIYKLVGLSNTQKVIISCRSGNLNRIKTRVYIPDIIEYRIENLEKKCIDKYFKAKRKQEKIQSLQKLRKENPGLIEDINDIFLIKLLWDTVENLDGDSTTIDLLSKKINLLLQSPAHQKNLNELNLLTPKDKEIINLNKEISYEYQQRFQFRMVHKDIQLLILKYYPRLDYISVNRILGYLADLFFDDGPKDGGGDLSPSYIYQHRRYQEYFFTLKLKNVYETNPEKLRGLRILSNHEYFEKLFLKYLRSQYIKENNLPRLLELNLIDVYLGNHRGWGADDPYFLNSSEFIPSLASQTSLSLEQLLEDENLRLKEKLLLDVAYIKKSFLEWSKDKKNRKNNEYLAGLWSTGVSNLIQNIRIFWDHDKKDFAELLIENLKQVHALFDKNKFLEKVKSEKLDIADPYWKSIEDWIYYRVVIKDENIGEVFNNLIRRNYENFSDNKNFLREESAKERLVKSFFRACIYKKKDELYSLIETFDEYEWVAFLDVLKSLDLLPIFIESTSIHDKVKQFLNTFSHKNIEVTQFIIFYKSLLSIALSEKEITFCNAEFEKLRNARRVDWHMDNTPVHYSLIAFSLNKNHFGELVNITEKSYPHYYGELQLYSALFNALIDLKRGTTSIKAIARDYSRYINTHEVAGTGLYLKVDISFLWSYLFKHSSGSTDEKSLVKGDLIKEEKNLILFSFDLQLKKIDSDLFNRLVNESELQAFEADLLDWKDDYPSYIDRCLYLGIFYSDINLQKAIYFVSKGINDGILRHGWRKDPIVSYFLVEALEILWRNNYVNKETLANYSKQVFELTLRVSEITDGKGTWQGPYNVVDLVAKFDLELAIKFKDKLIKEKGYYNFSNSVITSVLLGKVALGHDIKDIEELMSEYRRGYDYEGKPEEDYYEQILKVYMKIAQSDSYSQEEKNEAFLKGYELVEEVNKHKLPYFLNDTYFKEERKTYVELCKLFNKPNNLPEIASNQSEYISKPGMPEDKFIELLNQANTKRKLRNLYKKLNKFEERVILMKRTSWRILVEKTAAIEGNIDLVVNLLKEQSFPHTDFYTSNSKYLYYCVAAALDDLKTREQMLEYLSRYSGHGGFINIMKSYEVLGDKQMCIKLFSHLYKFCKFLVY